MEDFEKFVSGYIEAALFSSCDEEEVPLDKNYGPEDFTPHAMKEIRKDCKKFYKENYEMIKESVEQAGRDFWFTRCGHGAGFWDGDWPENGDKLSEASKEFGECWIIDNDDCTLDIL